MQHNAHSSVEGSRAYRTDQLGTEPKSMFVTVVTPVLLLETGCSVIFGMCHSCSTTHLDVEAGRGIVLGYQLLKGWWSGAYSGDCHTAERSLHIPQRVLGHKPYSIHHLVL